MASFGDQFTHVAAFDWSGARQANGIALAVFGPSDHTPRLIPPPDGRRWTRTQAHDWIAACRQASGQQRWLIGIDCAFALPAAVSSVWQCQSGPELWAKVEAASLAYPDHHGGGVVAHSALGRFFWQSGPRPKNWMEHHRHTEQVCRADGLGAPETPLKLIGAKQVGWGALAGMRVLHSLCAETCTGRCSQVPPERERNDRQSVAVWPFHPIVGADVVLVEIYPRLFLRLAGHGQQKIRTGVALDAALLALGAAPFGLSPQSPVSDHDADAIVAAAGLRLLANQPTLWGPANLVSALEGWIFAAGAGVALHLPRLVSPQRIIEEPTR